jgi:hypothetical protein
MKDSYAMQPAVQWPSSRTCIALFVHANVLSMPEPTKCGQMQGWASQPLVCSEHKRGLVCMAVAPQIHEAIGNGITTIKP